MLTLQDSAPGGSLLLRLRLLTAHPIRITPSPAIGPSPFLYVQQVVSFIW